jgi:hypothetical protein
MTVPNFSEHQLNQNVMEYKAVVSEQLYYKSIAKYAIVLVISPVILYYLWNVEMYLCYIFEAIFILLVHFIREQAVIEGD